jgi:hypothetical protein
MNAPRKWLDARLEKEVALAAPVTVRIDGDGTLVVTQKFEVVGATWWLQKFVRESRAESASQRRRGL